MEKKKKGTFGKIMGVFISLLFVAALASGFVSQYPRMAKDAKKVYDDAILNVDYGIARNYIDQVSELLYGFHVQYAKEVLGDERSPGEILMSGADEAELEKLKLWTESESDWFLDPSTGHIYAIPTVIPQSQILPTVTPTPTPTDFPEEQEAWEAYLDGYQIWYHEMVAFWDKKYEAEFQERLRDLNVRYCIRSRSNSSMWCGTESWEELVGDESAQEVRIQFEGGRPHVIYEFMSLETQMYAEEYFYNFREWTTYVGTVESGADLLEDTILFLALDESLFSADTGNSINEYWIHGSTFWDSVQALETNYAWFLLVALVMVFLTALVLSLIKPLRLRELRIANLPLEVLVAVIGLLCVFLIEAVPELITATQLSVDYPGSWIVWAGILKDIMVGEMEGKILLQVNTLAWFAIFFVIFFCFISVLQMFYKGFLTFLKRNTIIGRILCFICRKIKDMMAYATTLDFKEKGTKKLLVLVSVNGVLLFGIYMVLMLIVGAMCYWMFGMVVVAGVFGAIGLLLYSVVLFVYLQNKWNMIRLQYRELLDTTGEMASGDTKVSYNGKPGIFRDLQEQLQRVQEGFDTAVQEEVKSQRMKSELITNVSHDLKTPLTAIITYVDLLKNEEISAEEHREYVQVLEQKSARLKTLIEDLFEVSKANSGNIKLNPQELDLVSLIQEVQLNLEDRIMQSGIQFKFTAPQEKVMVCLDGQKTCRIFENLFVNITKYGLYGSRAFVDVESLEDKARVTVKNVSASEINYASDEIMERFTRGDASRNTEGSGLGLAIVKSFVEAQGGTVEIQLDGDLFKVIVTFPKCMSATGIGHEEPEASKDEAAETIAEEKTETEETSEEEIETEKAE